MMISAVTSTAPARSYTGVNFNGRKRNVNENYSETNSEYLNSIKKLAVPLAATILAMSPMSSSASSNMDIDVNSIDSELVVPQNQPKETLVATVDIPKDIKQFGGGFICLYSTDDNLNNAEKALLIKTQPSRGRIIKIDMTDGLLVKKLYTPKGDYATTAYYIKGGQQISENKNGNTKKFKLGSTTQIDKGFFDFIVKAFGDGIDVEHQEIKMAGSGNNLDVLLSID